MLFMTPLHELSVLCASTVIVVSAKCVIARIFRESFCEAVCNRKYPDLSALMVFGSIPIDLNVSATRNGERLVIGLSVVDLIIKKVGSCAFSFSVLMSGWFGGGLESGFFLFVAIGVVVLSDSIKGSKNWRI